MRRSRVDVPVLFPEMTENPWFTGKTRDRTSSSSANGLTTLELCAGAGGQALGYEQAGVDHVGLTQIAEKHPEIAVLLGSDYVIAPDVLIVRDPEPNEIIDSNQILVDDAGALRSNNRKRNNALPLLHASISCKWTLRSDRAQNARSEALNLIRNRKGRVRHIVVVTGEPLPSRLAPIALGTGDIDCVYHFALPELIASVDKLGIEDSANLVRIMVEGKRLKDIADLPLDLAV